MGSSEAMAEILGDKSVCQHVKSYLEFLSKVEEQQKVTSIFTIRATAVANCSTMFHPWSSKHFLQK